MLTEQKNRIIAGAILDMALSAGDLDTAASIFEDLGERISPRRLELLSVSRNANLSSGEREAIDAEIEALAFGDMTGMLPIFSPGARRFNLPAY